MSDIKSPCDKTASFGGAGKLCADKPKTGSPEREIDLSLAPPPPGLLDDLVTISGQKPANSEPSSPQQLFQAYKDSPVKPMLGGPLGIKGVNVQIKI